MSATATTACSMCHGSGYTVAGTPCSCGSLANRLTTSNKSDQAHLALLRAELAILRSELRAAEKENARIQDALIPKPLQPANVPHAYMLEEAARHANYWVEGARNAPDRTAAFICLHSSVNGWKNAAYAMAEKRMAAEARITEQATQIEALEKDAARLDWFERMFVHSWNGVIGTGSLTHWVLAGDYRHQVAKMQGRLFRAAIDAAILGDSHVR